MESVSEVQTNHRLSLTDLQEKQSRMLPPFPQTPSTTHPAASRGPSRRRAAPPQDGGRTEPCPRQRNRHGTARTKGYLPTGSLPPFSRELSCRPPPSFQRLHNRPRRAADAQPRPRTRTQRSLAGRAAANAETAGADGGRDCAAAGARRGGGRRAEGADLCTERGAVRAMASRLEVAVVGAGCRVKEKAKPCKWEL